MISPIDALNRLTEENQQTESTLQSCQTIVDGLIPNLLESQNPEAAELEQQLTGLEEILKAHFQCEEESVLQAFRKWGNPELILPLEEVIQEKEHILRELAALRKEVGNLIAYSIGLKPGYDNLVLSRKMRDLTSLIKSHGKQEETIFQEAKRLAVEKGETPLL